MTADAPAQRVRGSVGRDDLLGFLRTHRFFAGLDESARVDVAKRLSLRRVSPDEHILIEGETAKYGYIILRGRVRIYRLSASGREQALLDLTPGQAFNLVPLIDGKPNPSSAVARTEGLLCVLHKETLEYVRRTYSPVSEALLLDFAGRLRYLTGLVEDLSLRTVPERLARFLLRSAEERQTVPQPFTQGELATRLGTVREVISRTLRGLEKEGLISIQRHQIRILEWERLAALAEWSDPFSGD